MTKALEGGEGSVSRPGRSLPPGKTRYPLYRRLCGPQGRSGQVRKTSPPLGFDHRTVQPVVSRYTDYATRPTVFTVAMCNTSQPQVWWDILALRVYFKVKDHRLSGDRHYLFSTIAATVRIRRPFPQSTYVGRAKP